MLRFMCQKGPFRAQLALLYATIQVQSISVPTRAYGTVTVYLAKQRNLNCNWVIKRAVFYSGSG